MHHPIAVIIIISLSLAVEFLSPGTYPLQATLQPTTQASIFGLQHFRYYV
jgi:hypothetical protein